jgi:hypothetical protein
MTDAPTPVTIPGADLAELIAAAEECAGDFEAHLDHAYADRVVFPRYKRKYYLSRLRAALAKLKGDAE